MFNDGQTGLIGCQQHFRSPQCGISGRVHNRSRNLNQADPDGALDLHVVAECAGEIDFANRSDVRVKFTQQNPKARRDCALGQLQLANVRLMQQPLALPL